MPGLDEGTPLFVQIAEQYVDPMVAEASRLGIDRDTLESLIRETSLNNGSRTR